MSYIILQIDKIAFMNSALKKIILMLFVAAFSSSLWAQAQKITGKIISDEDSKPLSGVSITVKGKTIGTQTKDVYKRQAISRAL